MREPTATSLQIDTLAVLEMIAERLARIESILVGQAGASVPAARVASALGADGPPAPGEPAREWLVTMRRRLGLSQEQLAEMLGVVAVTVHRWETGKSPLPYEQRWIVAKRLAEKNGHAPPAE